MIFVLQNQSLFECRRRGKYLPKNKFIFFWIIKKIILYLSSQFKHKSIMEKSKSELISDISECNSVQKLELIILLLVTGLTLDVKNENDYIELFEITIDRLKIVSMINGEYSLLCEIDIKKDREIIEFLVLKSLLVPENITSQVNISLN